MNGSHTYQGCYCGGTESYMLDESTIIVYTLPSDFDGEHPEYEDKIKRCVFYLGEDKLIQSRVYPDGRDGGEASLAGDIRKAVQKTVSELWEAPNYWENKQGVRACESVIITKGVHYEDYSNYEDCNVSFMKRIDGYKNKKMIVVGHNPICPECGSVHKTEENIFCGDCSEDKMICYECGTFVSSTEIIMIDNKPICNNCVNDYYTWSYYEDRYIRDNELVETEEGRICFKDGFGYEVCNECGEIHDDDVCYYDEETCSYYCQECYDALMEQRENCE